MTKKITSIGGYEIGGTSDVATKTTNGLMSSADKSKLDGIASGANNYSHPSYIAQAAGFYKIGRDATGHVTIGDSFTIPTSLPASDLSAWAKKPDKPSYTAKEVGALPIEGGTLGGNLNFENFTTDARGIMGTVGNNDYWRIVKIPGFIDKFLADSTLL